MGLVSISHVDDVPEGDGFHTCVSDSTSGHPQIFQNTQVVGRSDSLFYTTVAFSGNVTLGAMLDTGSMCYTMNEFAERLLLDSGAISNLDMFTPDVTLVGVGGRRVVPKSAFNVRMEVYGCNVIVPTLVVGRQHDELILGTNVIKHILRESKQCVAY